MNCAETEDGFWKVPEQRRDQGGQDEVRKQQCPGRRKQRGQAQQSLGDHLEVGLPLRRGPFRAGTSHSCSEGSLRQPEKGPSSPSSRGGARSGGWGRACCEPALLAVGLEKGRCGG